MNREEHKAVRRIDAVKRRMYRAICVFGTDTQVFVEYKPRKDSVEATGYLKYKGENYRFDYEMFMSEPLPTIAALRDELWDDLQWQYEQWRR